MESPKKYVAKVDSIYSATTPEKPVAKIAIFSNVDLCTNGKYDYKHQVNKTDPPMYENASIIAAPMLGCS